jgi:hypothetical protein
MAVHPGRVSLAEIASCFEGVIPSPICTCSGDGVPNVTYLSIVHRIDEHHVGLSVQFFNKTRRNILENPRAQVLLVVPETGDQYRLDLAFERTVVSGEVFDRMRTRLEAVASQTGMTHVFALRGVDVFRVLDCRPLVAEAATASAGGGDHLDKLARCTARLAARSDLDALVNEALAALAEVYGVEHAFLMVPDEAGRTLYTIASRGFAVSGVGSEVAIGAGFIGVAAARRTAIRSTHLERDFKMSRAIRSEIARSGDEGLLDREIPVPGLPDARSQLVVPLVARDDLLGVLCLQSAAPGRFLADEERAMQILGRQLAACMALLTFDRDAAEPIPIEAPAPRVHGGAAATIKCYQSDDSVFVEGRYLVKGVPGRILRKLLRAYLDDGRTDFTNKEIRLDPELRLPEFHDNLEARLILLRRRLEERCGFVKIAHVARGQVRLVVERPIRMEVCR